MGAARLAASAPRNVLRTRVALALLLAAAVVAGRGVALAGVAALGPAVALALPHLWPVPGGATGDASRPAAASPARWLRWATAGAVAAGTAWVASPLSTLAMAALLALAVGLAPRLPERPMALPALLTLGCALATLAAHASAPPLEIAAAACVQGGLGALAGWVAWAAGRRPADALGSPHAWGDGGGPVVGELLAPALCAGTCGAGLADLPGGGFAAAAVVGGAVLAAARGPAEGTLAGATAGLIAGAAVGPGVPAAAAAAMGGAAAGLCRRGPAWAVGLAAALANAIAAALAPVPAWGWALGAGLGALAGSLTGAGRMRQDAGLGTAQPAGLPPGPASAPLPLRVVERLRASAEACVALGRDLAAGPVLPGEGEWDSDLGLRIAEQVCPGCPAVAACWERKLPRARRMVAELWRAAETGPVSWQQVGGPATIFCLRPREMAETANRLAALGRQRREFLEILAHSRRSAVSPLIGLGRSLAELAEEVAAASEAPAEAAAPVPAGPPLLTRWERAAGSGALGYEVVAAFLPRPGRSLSGDSVRCRLLRGDRLALVLSDGMGSGEPAAVVSAATAEHVLACLAAGRSPTDALRQTNEQLAADSPGERFATVDLAIVHLRGGLLEWYKMGAAPAWLSQGRGVRELGGGGLPAGILPAPEIRSGRTRLRPGESLVLVSDGILDRPVGAALGRAGRGRWAADWLRRHQVHAGGAALAQGLCEAARQRTAGGVHDDLTVVVCRLCETVGAGGSAYGAGDAAGAGAAGGA